jgi:hypothetical protein
MSNSEAVNPKRKVSKWLIVVGVLILAYFVTYFGESGSGSGKPKTTFMGSVLKIEVINPAAVNVLFQFRNVGSENGIPDCKVKVQDVSGTYSGYDYPIINTVVKPMETISGNMTLTIRNQGASFVTEGSVTCD